MFSIPTNVGDNMRMSLEDLRDAWSARDPWVFEDAATSAGRVAAIARAAELIRQWVKPDDVVLDVGCGVGLLAEWLRDVQLIGVDFSWSLLAAAKKRLPVMQADAFALPVRPNRVAVVACMFVLDDYDTATKRQALSHLASVLRPPGYLLVAGYAPDDDRMGPRRREVSAGEADVYLENELFYREALGATGDRTTFNLEHVRTTVEVSAIHGVQKRAAVQRSAPSPMQRHFIIASVVTGD
jgi:SAM-dependent methyltransferase